ncbi:hypothetical protein [Halomarina litorea]|uniref:hypothetical protein n=1 Tax=Halomarina litorea TaxID=2961595 RepID=UPI0020C313B9|nr:hypothetical protein [Halomarina sp. BCD28]
MGGKETETCGRCAMSSVSGTMEDAPDPFAGDRIEVSEDEARLVSPGAWLSGVKDRLDAAASRFVYGR